MTESEEAIAWIETAPAAVAKHIDAPEHMRRVDVMVVANGREVQVDVRWSVGVGRSLACYSAKTLVEAVRLTRARLRELSLD